jgi:hypothetical protein
MGPVSLSPHSEELADCSDRELDPFDTLPSCFCRINCSSGLPSTLRPSKLSLFFKLSQYNPACISPLPHFPPPLCDLGCTKHLICHHKYAGQLGSNEFKG